MAAVTSDAPRDAADIARQLVPNDQPFHVQLGFDSPACTHTVTEVLHALGLKRHPSTGNPVHRRDVALRFIAEQSTKDVLTVVSNALRDQWVMQGNLSLVDPERLHVGWAKFLDPPKSPLSPAASQKTAEQARDERAARVRKLRADLESAKLRADYMHETPAEKKKAEKDIERYSAELRELGVAP